MNKKFFAKYYGDIIEKGFTVDTPTIACGPSTQTLGASLRGEKDKDDERIILSMLTTKEEGIYKHVINLLESVGNNGKRFKIRLMAFLIFRRYFEMVALNNLPENNTFRQLACSKQSKLSDYTMFELIDIACCLKEFLEAERYCTKYLPQGVYYEVLDETALMMLMKAAPTVYLKKGDYNSYRDKSKYRFNSGLTKECSTFEYGYGGDYGTFSSRASTFADYINVKLPQKVMLEAICAAEKYFNSFPYALTVDLHSTHIDQSAEKPRTQFDSSVTWSYTPSCELSVSIDSFVWVMEC